MQVKDGKTAPYNVRLADGQLLPSVDISTAAALLRQAEKDRGREIATEEFNSILLDMTTWPNEYCGRMARYLLSDREAIAALRAAPAETAKPTTNPRPVITMEDFLRKYGTRGARDIIKELAVKGHGIRMDSLLFAKSAELAGDLEAALSAFLLEQGVRRNQR